jgi:hypothetical protein
MIDKKEQPYWIRQLLATLSQAIGIEKVSNETLKQPITNEPVHHAIPESIDDIPTEPLDVFPETPQDSDVFSDLGRIVPCHFNNIDGWLASNYRKPYYKGLKFEGKKTPIKPSNRTHIACHITATHFGTMSSRRSVWKKLIQSGTIPAEVLSRYDTGDIDKTAARLALHERFWTVPYHVVGLRNGDVLLNNHLTSYTFHGNFLNDEAIGLASEANLPGLAKNRNSKHTVTDEHWVMTNRRAFEVAYELAMNENMPIQGVRCHRQASNGRVGDPGEEYYRLILRPMAEKLKLTIDLDYKVGTGLPIPREWDERGKVNYRGTRITGK